MNLSSLDRNNDTTNANANNNINYNVFLTKTSKTKMQSTTFAKYITNPDIWFVTSSTQQTSSYPCLLFRV